MIVVGLDGATFDLIKPWVAEGKLPTFARLLAEGTHAELRGTLPTATASLSTSAATGMNPGKHNVFDRPLAGGDRGGRRVWDIAAEHGKRVGIVRLPLTDGAERLAHGVVISEVATANGSDADALAIDDVRAFRDEVLDLQRMQNAEMLTLLEHDAWDLLWVGFDVLDKVQRFFWHYMTPAHPAHPGPSDLGDTILRAYALVDDCLAEVVKRLDERTGLLLVSSHGARAAESLVAVGDWVEESGFLATKTELVTSVQRALTGIGNEAYAFLRALRRSGLGWLPNLMPQRPKAAAASAKTVAPCAAKRIDWSSTRVFCQGASGLRVNLRGREPEGIVAPEDFDCVRHEVRDALLQLVDPATGRKVMHAVHFREEIYRGPFAENGPDLLVEAAESYGLVESRDGAVIAETGRTEGARTGNRTRTGIFVLAGAPARAGVEIAALDVCDVAPTLLHLLDLPVPTDLDGVVATAALGRDPERVTARGHDRRVAPGTSEGLGYQ
jgi:predicted AlkP superfamily phosphohydrolase/phosphomutase